jgi:hypothetical protein
MFYYCFKHFKCNFDCVLSELIQMRGRRVHDHMVVRFTIKYAISIYHNESFEFEPRSWRDILDITLCDKVCQ